MLNALSILSGRTVDSVAWLLLQNMIVPGGLLRAGIALDRLNQGELRLKPGIPFATDRLFGPVRT